MKVKITIIVPFYNENKNLIETLKMILKQVSLPDEIIFVNSGSTDNTSIIIKKYLKNYNLKLLPKIKIINKKTFLPSTSKNLGAENAMNDYIIFLDCGLKIGSKWLFNLKNNLKKNYDVIVGTYYFDTNSNFDLGCLSQLYGYKKVGICVPSTLIKKKLFLKYFKFQKARAGYDRVWLNQIKNNKNYKVYFNKTNSVDYNGICISKNINNLFKKIYLYSLASCKVKGYDLQSKYLITSVIFLISLTIFHEKSLYFFSIIYFLMIIKKFFSNNHLDKKFLSIKVFLNSIIARIIIDLARIFAFSNNLIEKLK
jgi:glycosyltransferase involved in cell wall biosynthesis